MKLLNLFIVIVDVMIIDIIYNVLFICIGNLVCFIFVEGIFNELG